MKKKPLITAEDIGRYLSEDIGKGDVTTDSIVPPDAEASAAFTAKEDFTLAGMTEACAIIKYLDPALEVLYAKEDGDLIKRGEIFCRIRGSLRAILTAERTALNLLQRLCGIATLASKYAAAVKGKTRILDTRKTTPGLRLLEKYAVRIGGCHNYRIGLDDGVLIKDNHIRAAGGVKEAVRRAKQGAHHLLQVEVEVTNLEELQEALDAGVDAVLLDNMPDEMIAGAVKIASGKVRTEVSGNVTLERISKLCELGVDYISVGELTHSARAVDISLQINSASDTK